MKRPKNFLFLILLLSVVAVVVIAAVVHSAREQHLAGRTLPTTEAGSVSQTPSLVSGTARPAGTPSAAAQKRAQEFNDAASRFNAPDDQQH